MGKRTGKPRGRPPGAKNQDTLSKEMAREALREIVMREMEPMILAQISHAKGLSYFVGRDRLGKFKKLTSDEAQKALYEGGSSEYTVVEVWEKDPSVQAFTDLMNRALDKPKEQEQVINLKGSVDIVERLQAARRRLTNPCFLQAANRQQVQ
jgi:hypothetical protein